MFNKNKTLKTKIETEQSLTRVYEAIDACKRNVAMCDLEQSEYFDKLEQIVSQSIRSGQTENKDVLEYDVLLIRVIECFSKKIIKNVNDESEFAYIAEKANDELYDKMSEVFNKLLELRDNSTNISLNTGRGIKFRKTKGLKGFSKGNTDYNKGHEQVMLSDLNALCETLEPQLENIIKKYNIDLLNAETKNLRNNLEETNIVSDKNSIYKKLKEKMAKLTNEVNSYKLWRQTIEQNLEKYNMLTQTLDITSAIQFNNQGEASDKQYAKNADKYQKELKELKKSVERNEFIKKVNNLSVDDVTNIDDEFNAIQQKISSLDFNDIDLDEGLNVKRESEKK